MFVSFDVADEDKGVVVLNLLHGRLSGQGVLDDVVGIHAVPAWGGLARVFRSSGRPEGLWPVELHTSSDLQRASFQSFFSESKLPSSLLCRELPSPPSSAPFWLSELLPRVPLG